MTYDADTIIKIISGFTCIVACLLSMISILHANRKKDSEPETYTVECPLKYTHDCELIQASECRSFYQNGEEINSPCEIVKGNDSKIKCQASDVKICNLRT